ncbi:MAG: 30S ribosomal protein S11, partial [Candidatus Pacebacteria bacterium]|nr:30S ribosomal protein S11 [Candidatus Paceibacterota bacterium]
MGKKRIIQKSGGEMDLDKAKRSIKSGKKKFPTGKLFVHATYNNTKATVTDPKGGTLAWSSSGLLGFKGAKKGTPFAAAKVGEILAEKAAAFGMREAHVVVRG